MADCHLNRVSQALFFANAKEAPDFLGIAGQIRLFLRQRGHSLQKEEARARIGRAKP
jgi:hypothetical protein